MHLRPADTTPAISKSGNPPNIAKSKTICKGRTDLSLLAHAVDTAYALHNRTNGSTVSIAHGNMMGKRLFSVSIYPSHSITLWERPSWQESFEFAKANLDLLLKADHALGTWFNDWDLVHVVDIVICIPNRDLALELGRRFDQLAIFDLEARREIPIMRVPQDATAKLGEVGND